MPRVCTVCSHPEVDAINRQLMSGLTYRMIANHYAVTWQAARRHVLEHIPMELAKAKQAEEASRASDLLDMVIQRDHKALQLMSAAEADGDIKTALQALRVSLISLELLAKLRGELNEHSQVNVFVLPEYLAVRAAVVRALAPYAEARVAVVAALAQLQGGGGESNADTG